MMEEEVKEEKERNVKENGGGIILLVHSTFAFCLSFFLPIMFLQDFLLPLLFSPPSQKTGKREDKMDQLNENKPKDNRS